MNLKLKLLLQMINNLSGPAKDARRDLKGVKSEADTLKNTSAGDKLASDLKRISDNAAKAKRDMMALGAAARKTGAAGAAGAAAAAAGVQGKGKTYVVPNPPPRYQENEKKKQGGKESQGGAVVAGGGHRGLIAGVGAAYVVQQAIQRTAGEAITREAALANVKNKVNLSPGNSFADVERTIDQTAVKFGRTHAEMAELAAELGASGTASADLADQMTLATKVAVAWDISARKAGEGLAKIKTSGGWGKKQLEEFGDKVNWLGDNSASKEKDIVEMFQSASAGAKAAGVDHDTSLAFMTGMNSAGMGPEVSARGFGAMVSKLRIAKTSGGKDMEAGLKMLGLKPGEVEKGMKDNAQAMLLKVMERFSKAKDQAAAATKMFGGQWWDEFSRMAQAAEEIVKFLTGLSNRANWEGSTQKTLDNKMATTRSAIDRLQARSSGALAALGSLALQPIENAAGVVEKFIEGIEQKFGRNNPNTELADKVLAGGELTPEERERFRRSPRAQARVRAAREEKKNKAKEPEDEDAARGKRADAREPGIKAAEGVLDQFKPGSKEHEYQLGVIRELRKAQRAVRGKAERRPADRDERSDAARLETLRQQAETLKEIARLKRAGEELAPSPVSRQANEAAINEARSALQRERDAAIALAESYKSASEARSLFGSKFPVEAPKQAGEHGPKNMHGMGFKRFRPVPWGEPPKQIAPTPAADQTAAKPAEAENRIESLRRRWSTGAPIKTSPGRGQAMARAFEGKPAPAIPGAAPDKPAAAPEKRPFAYSFGAGQKRAPQAGETPGFDTDFAARIRAQMERLRPDLAPAGGLIMESLRAGIEGGTGAVGASADGARQAIEKPFRGMDLSAEGRAAMASVAAGIRAGESDAVAAANQAKARILGALSGLGGSGSSVRSRLGNANHDGVTGQ